MNGARKEAEKIATKVTNDKRAEEWVYVVRDKADHHLVFQHFQAEFYNNPSADNYSLLEKAMVAHQAEMSKDEMLKIADAHGKADLLAASLNK